MTLSLLLHTSFLNIWILAWSVFARGSNWEHSLLATNRRVLKFHFRFGCEVARLVSCEMRKMKTFLNQIVSVNRVSWIFRTGEWRSQSHSLLSTLDVSRCNKLDRIQVFTLAKACRTILKPVRPINKDKLFNNQKSLLSSLALKCLRQTGWKIYS